MTTTDAIIVAAIMAEASRLAAGNRDVTMTYHSPSEVKPIVDKNIEAAIKAFQQIKEALIQKHLIAPESDPDQQ